MKLQIRTLSVQERKELYTQALEYFSKPSGERDDAMVRGVCEFLHRKFYFRQISSDWSITRSIVESGLKKLDYKHIPVLLGKELMPELYRRKTRESSEEDDSWWGDYYWFNNDEERLIALEDCLYDITFLMEEEDEQGPTIFAEFEVDWEPAS